MKTAMEIVVSGMYAGISAVCVAIFTVWTITEYSTIDTSIKIIIFCLTIIAWMALGFISCNKIKNN